MDIQPSSSGMSEVFNTKGKRNYILFDKVVSLRCTVLKILEPLYMYMELNN